MNAAPVQVSVTLNWVECAGCGMPFGITPDFQQRRLDDHASYCPRGCSNVYKGPSEVERLRKQLEAEQRSATYWRQQRDAEREGKNATERRACALRGHLTRVRKRVGNGVCPCCQRTFGNLQRHMRSQHPDYGVPPAGA